MIIPIQVTLQAVSYSSVVNILSATVALKLKIHIKALVAYTISCEFLFNFFCCYWLDGLCLYQSVTAIGVKQHTAVGPF